MDRKTFNIVYWTMAAVISILVVIIGVLLGNQSTPANRGNNYHYPRYRVITMVDTVFIKDQDAYNIGYFDGNSDAYYQFDSINNAYVDND